MQQEGGWWIYASRFRLRLEHRVVSDGILGWNLFSIMLIDIDMITDTKVTWHPTKIQVINYVNYRKVMYSNKY